MIRNHLELSFEEKGPVCRFVVLVTFHMAEERYNMHLCAGGGNRLYHIPVRVYGCFREVSFVSLVFRDTLEQWLVVSRQLDLPIGTGITERNLSE